MTAKARLVVTSGRHLPGGDRRCRGGAGLEIEVEAGFDRVPLQIMRGLIERGAVQPQCRGGRPPVLGQQPLAAPAEAGRKLSDEALEVQAQRAPLLGPARACA